MINFVMKKFVKNLNDLSLSANERAILRDDFLARTGICASEEQPPLKSSFILTSPKKQTNDNINFELQLVEEPFNKNSKREKKDQKNLPNSRRDEIIQAIKQDVMVKVNLNIFDGNKINEQAVTPETYVIMKVARSKK